MNDAAVQAPPAPQKTDDRDYGIFELRVKPEYVLKERPESLGPIPEELIQNASGDPRESGKKQRKNKSKRARDERQDDAEKVCMAVMRNQPCPYGADKCRFSHDIKGYMATRPEDIKELEGGCPLFNLYGYCAYGISCRFGSSHITKAGENVRKPVLSSSEDVSIQQEHDHGPNLALPKDAQIQLRKKIFPFKCKMHFETDHKGTEVPTSSIQDTGTDAKEVLPVASSCTPVELKKHKIIDFSNKIYVAPLTTVGNLPFRRIMKKFGADITCGEMAVGTCLLEGKPSEWALLKRHPDEDVFGIQIAAAHPDQFTRVSELVEKFVDPDFVDLNLGCPLDLLCNKGAGAALMLREKKLKGALMGITAELSCPVTIKMRTGWDTNDPVAHKLVGKIQSWRLDGIAAIMVHGRSRLQRYQRLANWDYISSVAKSQSDEYPKIPIIGNGDIFSFEDYGVKMTHAGLSKTAMLGRGALIKPWLPTEIKECRHWDISSSERLDILKDFVKFGLEHWGSDQQGVNNTRRFLLEWLSFLHRYVPVGLLEVIPQQMNQRPPVYLCGRNDLETLFLSQHSADWIKISEMLLGAVPESFRFTPKHNASGYSQKESSLRQNNG